jgi:hypothetical protein
VICCILYGNINPCHSEPAEESRCEAPHEQNKVNNSQPAFAKSQKRAVFVCWQNFHLNSTFPNRGKVARSRAENVSEEFFGECIQNYTVNRKANLLTKSYSIIQLQKNHPSTLRVATLFVKEGRAALRA